MKDANTPSGKHRFGKWLKDSLIQECPPELYACEVCGQYECDNERWLNCEHRLKVRDQIRSLNDEESVEKTPCPHFNPEDAKPKE